MANKVHGNAWSDAKRIEVATAHVMGLNAAQIEIATGVSKDTVRHWRMADWFKDLVEEIQREDDYQVDAKLTKIVGKSLDTLVDRLENGDFMFDPKEGKFVRKPLAARDVVKVADIMYDKRNLLRGKPTTITAKDAVADRLLKLAEEFKRFALAKPVKGEIVREVIEAEVVPQTQGNAEVDHAVHDQREEGLQEGIPEVRGIEKGDSQAGASQ